MKRIYAVLEKNARGQNERSGVPPTGAVYNPQQSESRHSRNGHKFHPCHSQKERFLSGAPRASTRAIGEALWSRLKDGPATVNVSQVARETGYSKPTVYKALSFYTKFMKVFPVAGYSVGDSPGRPRLYDINPGLKL
jgi:hypothetical protein